MRREVFMMLHSSGPIVQKQAIEYDQTCMLVAEGRERLLDRLHRDGKVIAREIAEELCISEDSIRRDLRDLAAAGHCQRVYGGAVPVSRALAGYRARTDVEPESKQRIAVRAA